MKVQNFSAELPAERAAPGPPGLLAIAAEFGPIQQKNGDTSGAAHFDHFNDRFDGSILTCCRGLMKEEQRHGFGRPGTTGPPEIFFIRREGDGAQSGKLPDERAEAVDGLRPAGNEEHDLKLIRTGGRVHELVLIGPSIKGQIECGIIDAGQGREEGTDSRAKPLRLLPAARTNH